MNDQTNRSGSVQMTAEPESFPSPQRTIGARILYYAETQPDHPAVVSSDFAPLSYRGLQRLISETKTALRRAGFGRSARVAVAMPNSPQAALAIVATSCSAVSVPLNPRLTLQEIEKCLAAVRPDAILLLEGHESAARQAAKIAGVPIFEVLTKSGSLGFEIIEPLAGMADSDELDDPNPDAPAFVLQTSGTTSDSKLIPTSHRNMLAAAARVKTWFNLTSQDRCLSASPVFYAHGLHVTVFTPLLSGGSIAFPADASKFDYLEWFGNLRPSWYSAGPTLHRLIFEQSTTRLATDSAHSLRLIVSGGAPLPSEVLEGLQQAFGVPVLEHYGSSEGMQICSNQPPPGRAKPGTCGIPWPNTIKIVSEDGAQLRPGEHGEVLVGGPTVVSGYLNASDLTRTSFSDGWFRSGDIGSLDQDGFLTLYGRKDDLVNRGGEKISPAEVDEILLQHPSIAEAAAFSIPHPRLGQDIAAAVVLRPGMRVTPVELRRYLQDRVASFKVPRRIVIREQLPKGATGKVLRRLLTESFESTVAAGKPIATMNTVDGAVDTNLITQLTAIWERLLKVSPISPDEDFFEKGGDSLLAMEMLADLDKLIGEAIPASVLLDAPTIRQLALRLSERSILEPKHLVHIHPNGGKPPLILFHGDFIWGGGPLTKGLTNLLGNDQPLLVVIPHDASDEPIPASIEAMAADRLSLIVNAQPEGPYRLCGNCLGGIVAFEVARMLIAAGKEVDFVCMIDPPTVNASRSVQLLFSLMKLARPILGSSVEGALAWTWYRCAESQKFLNVSWERRWSAIKARIRNLGVSANMSFDSEGSGAVSSPLGHFSDARTVRYSAAMSNYAPRPLSARLIYISVDYGVGAWRRLNPDIEIIKSPGNHFQLDISKIADVLKACLQPKKK
jgi:acyl-CoA synthetase (AMP-forming)/AMP-acid ligase II/thioesterase domain-containing protein